MPLDQLLAALERDARTEADRLLAEARAAADAIRDASDAAVAEQRRAATGEHERALQQESERLLAEARLAARHEVLSARERLLDRVFAAVRAAVPEAIQGAQFRQGLPQRVRAGLSCFAGDEPLVVRCHPSLGEELRTLLNGRANMRIESDPQTFGLSFQTEDGRVTVDATLGARIDGRRAPLARRALARLELG